MTLLDKTTRLFSPLRHEPVLWLAVTAWLSVTAVNYLLFPPSGADVVPHADHWQWVQSVCLAALLGYGAAAAVHAARRRKWLRRTIKAVCYAVPLTLLAVHIFLTFSFGMTISPQTVTLFAETDSRETSEFLATYGVTPETFATLAIVTAQIALVVLLELTGWLKMFVQWMLKGLTMRRIATVAMTVVTIIGVFRLTSWGSLAMCRNSMQLAEWEKRNVPTSLDLMTATLHATQQLVCTSGDIRLALDQARAVYRTNPVVNETDSLTVIYVLGESYNKHHSPLYGYELNTTPNLVRERDIGNLFVFNDAIACYNATFAVVQNTFSCNSLSAGEYWFEKPLFPTVFKRAGYEVYYWDNQRVAWEEQLNTITINAYLFNDEIFPLTYTQVADRSFTFDLQLIDDFRQNARLDGTHRLVMFHLLGQHFNPFSRYPKEPQWMQFKPSDIKRDAPYLDHDARQHIAHYDNATLYNDAVINEILDLFRDQNAVMVYISDHGEEVFDYRDYAGRYGHDNPNPDMLRCQIQVPLLVWCSDRFLASHPQTVSRLRSAADRPFITDDICHLLFALAGIETEYYRADRDLLGHDYNPPKRLIFDRTTDYDAVMGR